jgi:hypothetical protein
MATGVELIAQERERQVTEEGWSAEHDDGHVRAELAWAAVCYAAPANIPNAERIRMLVKAGALIAAEIDRLLRLK